MKEWPSYASPRLSFKQIVGPVSAHSWWQKCRSGLQPRLCFSVSFCRGRSKRGSAPRGRHCRMRPLSFTSQPNLNLTMEPAQYACNPIHGPGSADLPEYLLFLHERVSACDRIAHEWVWWMCSLPLAKVHPVYTRSQNLEEK